MTPYFYLDFETNKAGDFFLAGYSAGGATWQVVLHFDLKALADAKGLPCLELGQFIENAVCGIQEMDATLVAYSDAEKDALLRYCAETNTRFGAKLRYLNLLKSAKRWIRTCHKAEFEALPPLRVGAGDFANARMRRSLASVMRLTDYHAPADYAPGGTTKRINDVRKGLRAKDNMFCDLTAVQKSKATKLLKHNRYDVEALPVLLGAIEAELPAALLAPIDDLIL